MVAVCGIAPVAARVVPVLTIPFSCEIENIVVVVVVVT